ncbi:MAG: ABC transporter ATP-binding protein [Candidatus Latescibacteria bacterium]|nr:ABC transporter ATP-binding protein [Candidatus Latescibacterota bacterium]
MNGPHEEERLQKSYDSALMRRLLAYIRPYKGYLISAAVLIGLSQVVRQAGPYLTKIAVDSYIVQKDLDGLNRIGLAFVCCLIVQFVADYFQNYLTQMMGQRVMYDIRSQVFAHLQKLPIAYFDRNPIGRLMTRATNDVQTLNEMFTSGVVTIFGDVLTLAVIVGMMVHMDAGLALISFAVLPALFGLTWWFRRRVREAYRESRVKIARLNAFLQENIAGMEVVQLFNREARNRGAFEGVNREYLRPQMRSVTYYSIFFPAMEVISSGAVALIIWYGGGKVVQSHMSIGVLIAFLQYIQRFFWPIRELSEKYNILQSAMASSERIFELLDTPPERQGGAQGTGRLEGRVAFRDVWFAYKGDDYVLKGVSFDVEPGHSVAVVGATGAGKSTLINLLCRFYEAQRGEVLVDGLDVKAWDARALRRRIGVVQQDVFMFSGTVARNIRLGAEIDEARVRRAAEDVNAARFIDRLPKGYEEDVRERGNLLSTGQRQLLAFARALAFDPDILVLDEATSNIDTETEILIQEAVGRLMKGRTSIVIAHRLSTIRNADRIVVLHHGEVREMGTHEELLAAQGIYYRLYQLQYKGQEATVERMAVREAGK